jgi:hypothetical protein
MQDYWQRRLDEARKINDQIEADLETALASVAPEAAEPVRAVIGAGAATATSRRRYGRAVPRMAVWSERRGADGARESSLQIVEPRSPHQLQITVFPSAWGTVPSAPAYSGGESAVAAPARRIVGPLWFRGVVAAMYALTSNLVLYVGLLAVGATERISTSASLPATFAVTSILVAATGTVAFALLRRWLAWPDTAFRLLGAAGLVALLVSFIVSPGATFLAAILAVVMTTTSLGSELASD